MLDQSNVFFEQLERMGLKKSEDIAKAYDFAMPNSFEKAKKTDMIRGVKEFNRFFRQIQP